MRHLARWLGGVLSFAVLAAGAALAKDEAVKEADVPAAVKGALQKKYPGATYQRFRKEDDKGTVRYDVKLTHKAKKTVDGKEVETERLLEVELTAEGKILEEAERLKEPPEPVTKALKGSKYAAMKMTKIERVVKNEDEKTLKFEVSLMNEDEDVYEVDVDASGKITREEESDDDDDGGDDDEDDD
jgi:hypothetical protein